MISGVLAMLEKGEEVRVKVSEMDGDEAEDEDIDLEIGRLGNGYSEEIEL